jgi:SH3-like domain-containing protein
MAVIRAKYTVDTGQTFIWGEQNQVPVVHLSDTRFFTMFNPFSKFGIKAAHDTITLATTGSETWLHHFVRSKQPAGDTVLAQGVPPRAHHEYVRIDVAAAEIRVDPNTSATVVGKAVKGDMFEYEGRQGDWLKINLFSGEYRWVRASVASLTRDVPAYLAPWNERKSIFEAMVRAEDRAERDARTRYPDPADFERKKDLERLLDDRYKLEVAHATGFPVLRWGYLMAEAVHGGWTPPRR